MIVQPDKENLPPHFETLNDKEANGEAPAVRPHQLPDLLNAGVVGETVQREVQTARRPRHHVLRGLHILLIIYIIVLAFIGFLAFWVHVHPVLGVDVFITREFQENHAPWLETFMVAVSYLGNTAWLFVLLVVIATVAFWLLHFRLASVTFLVVNITSLLINLGIKLLVARPRPSASLVDVFHHALGNSFPSGHVMTYVAFWGLLFAFTLILFRGWRWWKIILLVLCAFFIILVGPSRIYLGDHWASDVLGGYLIEGLWLWFSLWVYTKLHERGVLVDTRLRVH